MPTLNPGDDLQAAVNGNPGATTFTLNPGTYNSQQVFPKSGNTFIGVPGAILDGQNVTAHAFYSNNLHQSSVTIQGLEIKNYTTPSAARGAITGDDVTGWRVEDCIVHHCLEAGIRCGAGTGWIVRNNICYSNNRNGIAGFQCHGALIEGNELYANGFGSGLANPAGVKILGASDLTYRGNNVHDNMGVGIWSDTNLSTTIIEDNIVTNTAIPTGGGGQGGIWHEVSYAAIIRNNLVSGNGSPSTPITGWIDRAGIQITNSPNVEVYGNTVLSNAQGITVMYATGYPASGAEGSHRVENLNVHDNTVRMLVGQTGMATNTGDLSIFTSLNNHFTHNSYLVNSLSRAWFRWGGA